MAFAYATGSPDYKGFSEEKEPTNIRNTYKEAINSQLVKNGKITIHHMPTQDMLADVCTKHLAKTAFRNILSQIKDFEG